MDEVKLNDIIGVPIYLFRNTDVGLHQNGVMYSLQNGNLHFESARVGVGKNEHGVFVEIVQDWSYDGQYISTSVQSYQNMAIFSQHYPSGLQNVSTASENAKNEVSTLWPSLQLFSETVTEERLSYLSLGGFMSGWAALSVGSLDTDIDNIKVRDGEYGGPLSLFNENLDQVVILSSLNNFMVNSMAHNKQDESFQFGLMASVEHVPENETLQTILYYDSSLWGAYEGWGQVLQSRGGVKDRSKDVVTNYLGYWTDNGAFYYYNTLPSTNYEDTILEIQRNLSEKLPLRYINYDSWWYIKGEDLGVKSWTAQEEIFPSGMEALFNKTKLPVIAHNRYWATDTDYSLENGGQFHFIMEKHNKRALPQDEDFWPTLFGSSVEWGLSVYEQDWQDRQTVDMNVTHSSFTAARDWLLQMGAGALQHNVTLQYCMSLPRHALQSVEVASVGRIRTSGDYILSKVSARL